MGTLIYLSPFNGKSVSISNGINEVKTQKNEINTLKKEVTEIKDLLKDIVEKLHG